MFEPLKKIILLNCLVVGMFLLPTVSAYGQKITAEVRSAEDFAKTHGGSQYADVLSKKGEDKSIVCGNPSTLCNKEKEYCLKCTVKTFSSSQYGGSSSTSTDYGKCIAKDKYIEGNLKANWPDDGNCLDKMKSFIGGYTIYPGQVSLERTGFLAKNTTDALFYHHEMGHEFTDSAGRKYRLYVSDVPTIVYGGSDSGKEFNGCEVLPVKIYNMQSCFFCPLARLIFSAANKVTINAFSIFAPSFRIVIAMVFGIWLALAALGQVFPMTKQDAPKFLAAILKQGFKFMLAFTLLFYGNDLFKYFVVPVLDSGLVMGEEIQTVAMPTPENYKAKDSISEKTYYNLPDAEGKTLYNKIEVYLASLQARLSYVQAIGTTVFCVGSHKISLWDLITKLSDFTAGLRMMLLGGILVSFSFLLTMAFAFYFMDAILQLAVIGAMIPFMIAGWPFRATAQYAGTGFKMLLNTFFAMFFTGFVISTNVELINQSLAFSQDAKETQDGKENKNLKKENSKELDGAKEETASGFNKIVEAINEQNWDKINKNTDIGGTGFLLLAFCCIFGFKFVAQVSPLASKLSAGGFSKGGIAGRIGTMAASTAKGMATKAAAPVGKVAGNAALGAVGSVAQTAANTAGNIAGGTLKLAGRGAKAIGMKKTGAVLNATGSAVNSVSRGVGKIAKGAADGMKKQ